MDTVIAFTSRGISIFGFTLAWYGIIITAAVALAIVLCYKDAKRVGIEQDSIIDLALLLIPLAIVGARLYYVIFEWDMFKDNLLRIFDLRSGGLAIYGGVIMGIVAVLIFSRWKKISIWKLLDLVVPALILAQGIGRWGNFINQEAYGYTITNPALQWFPFAVFIEATGRWHYATFFYESIWCIGGFIALWWYRKRSKRDGNVFAAYWAIYGFERAIVEGLRTDSLWLGSIRVSQVLSAVMCLAAVAYLIAQWAVRRKKESDLALGTAAVVDESLKIIPEYEGDDGDFLAAQKSETQQAEAQADLPDEEPENTEEDEGNQEDEPDA